MKVTVESSDVLANAADLLVITTSQPVPNKGSLYFAVNQKLKGELAAVLKKEDFKGKLGETKTLYTSGRLKARYVLILGLGEPKNFTLESARKCGATLRAVGDSLKAQKITVALPGSGHPKFTNAELTQALVEGIVLSSYQFTHYTKSKKAGIEKIAVHLSSRKDLNAAKSAADRALTLSQAVFLARDLVNLPANEATPLKLAKTAQGLPGVRTRIHNLAAIRKLKMGAFLGVAAGSTANPPYFIEMHYTPKGKPKKKIAIIGKGVTFDSGGYSIKPAKSMETMKDDMAGAAAVIGLMSIIRKLNPKVAVSGYVAATENMVDGFGQRPGDVVHTMSGKTVEVLNTDAEGRLTLADAMTYALKGKPDLMIDMATLTGACLVALGMNYSAIMGNDQNLIDTLIACGKETGENLWQLPLVEDYKEELKSPIADLKNIGGPYAGSINGGLFLEAFCGGVKWAHLDIAGPAFTERPLPYIPRGGTGVMIRTLAKFLADV